MNYISDCSALICFGQTETLNTTNTQQQCELTKRLWSLFPELPLVLSVCVLFLHNILATHVWIFSNIGGRVSLNDSVLQLVNKNIVQTTHFRDISASNRPRETILKLILITKLFPVKWHHITNDVMKKSQNVLKMMSCIVQKHILQVMSASYFIIDNV